MIKIVPTRVAPLTRSRRFRSARFSETSCRRAGHMASTGTSPPPLPQRVCVYIARRRRFVISAASSGARVTPHNQTALRDVSRICSNGGGRRRKYRPSHLTSHGFSAPFRLFLSFDLLFWVLKETVHLPQHVILSEIAVL